MLNSLVFFATLGVTFGDFNVLLLHTNDMHSHFEPTDKYSGICQDDNSTQCYGGFARLQAEVDARKKEAAAKGLPTIFLNAGDSYQGTPYFTFFKWPIVSEFVNMLGIDVMALGNHEFDDGIPGLAPFIQNSTAAVVCSNVNISKEPLLNQPNLTPSKIINVNGTRIGVIGYLTPETTLLSTTGKVQFLDEIQSIREEARKLRRQNVYIIIALGHSGYDKDKQIAKEVADVDLVVGGHSHSFLYTGTQPDQEVPEGPYPTVITQVSGKKVPVVQAYYATKYLGYLELNFDDDGNLNGYKGSPILLSGKLPQDPEVVQKLTPYKEEIAEKIHKIVGYAGVLLDNNNMKCKLGECNMGNIITDSYVDYVARHYNSSNGWTMAAVGINQAGGIRASINTETNVNHNGSITVEDLMSVLPWGDKLVVLTMSGSLLMQALEYSVARYQQTISGHVSEFFQVSGLKLVFDMKLPSGHRVISAEVRCDCCDVPAYLPLQSGEMYSVIMPEYLAMGGDGYAMFAPLPNTVILDDIDYIVVAEYLEMKSPVFTGIEGRITIKGSDLVVKGAASSLSGTWIVMSLLLILAVI